MRAKYVVIGVLVGVLLTSTAIVLAGSVDPPSGPSDAASQMYTLRQIYRRLEGGIETNKMASFTEPSSGPGAGTMRTLDKIMSIAPKIDDTNGATAADVVSGKTFWGLTTGGWGPTTGTAAAKPDPPCFNNIHRYVDCGNGTVHDTVTNLIWLKNANCFGYMYYAAGNNAAAGLEHGERGLFVRMSPAAVDTTCEKIQQGVKKLVTAGHPPVLLVSPRIRPGLRQIVAPSMPRLRVLSYNEITQDTRIESYGVISDQ